MATLRAKLKKALLLTSTLVFFLVKFIIDIILANVDIEENWLTFSRQFFAIGGLVGFYLLVESLWKRDQSPVRKLGFALVVALMVGVAAGALSLLPSDGFDVKNLSLIPQGFDAVLIANLFGVVFGVTGIITLLIIRDIIFWKRRKNTRRNFFIVLILILLTVVSTLPYRSLETGTVSSTLYAVTIIGIVVNSFRLSWIVYLTKREKLISMAYGFALFLIFIGFYIMTVSEGSMVMQGVSYYSRQLASFLACVEMFAIIYFGMTFISTLFHLPTAEAFDRKTSEVSSLHNLSRLVTQVFDFEELVNSVTRMTMEVCEAKSAWLEVIADQSESPQQRSSLMPAVPSSRDGEMKTVALRNITPEEVELILSSNHQSIRRLILDSRKPVVIDQVQSDQRMEHLADSKTKFNSMVSVPLISHDRVIGILYATKGMEFGFDKDDIDLISAFADQATIAIENSRLIKESLERERLMREMILAQEMQRKLLPQQLPQITEVDIEALSTPALEVGGDYYDFAMLDEDHLAVLVGDVSGKGVSAAFYMAEMKGIFQSLSRIYRSPREFLTKAHEALIGTIDKRSFISLIYAVLDLRTGIMTIARAGHCPMLYVSNGSAEYVKPTGLGLGMGSSDFFGRTISEEQLQFRYGDVVVFYTDGVTEAHPKSEDEFGYERLLEVTREASNKSAEEVRDAIIMAVDNHMNHESPEDDLTIVVVKWKKKND